MASDRDHLYRLALVYDQTRKSTLQEYPSKVLSAQDRLEDRLVLYLCQCSCLQLC